MSEKKITVSELKEELDRLFKRVDEIEEFLTPIEEEFEVPTDPEYYMCELADKFELSFDDMCTFMHHFENRISLGAAYSIMLKAIALVLDEQYPDHISNVKEFYVMSTIDGKIYKHENKNVKSFKNFAAFRTMEDAQFALKMVSQMRALYNEQED